MVFVPRKFQAKQIARVGGDLWGYLAGGREQADYYLGTDGIPIETTAQVLRAAMGTPRPGAAGPGGVRAAGRRLPSPDRRAAGQGLPHHPDRPNHR